MDSDMLVVKPIDHVVHRYSNASFLAAPEIFPPDTFNSGFMVFTPSLETHNHLLELNDVVGSNDGGDQGVFNNGLCPNWYTADSTDTDCGRLPWRYNVEYHLFGLQHIYSQSTAQPIPAVLHFIGLKPWKVLQADYSDSLDPSMKARIIELADSHILWRDALYRASEKLGLSLPPEPSTSVLYQKKLSERCAIDYQVGGGSEDREIDAYISDYNDKQRFSNARDADEDRGVDDVDEGFFFSEEGEVSVSIGPNKGKVPKAKRRAATKGKGKAKRRAKGFNFDDTSATAKRRTRH